MIGVLLSGVIKLLVVNKKVNIVLLNLNILSPNVCRFTDNPERF